MAFEGAGWPEALDKGIIRARIRELEQGRSEAFDVLKARLIARLTSRLRGKFGGRRQDRVASDRPH
jgi:hypothetical protein